MSLDTLLVTAAAELATGMVLLGMLLAWGLSGGDGLQPNPVAPVAGLVVFFASLAVWAVTIGLLSSPWGLVFGGVLLGGVVAWAWLFTAFPDDGARRRIVAGLAGVAVLVPPVLALVAHAESPSRGTVLLAATPLLAELVGLAASGELRRVARDWRSWALIALPFVGVPALHLAGVLLD